MKPPSVWQKANSERFTRLGALVTRRKLLHLDLSNVDREINDVQTEILAIERTSGMASEVEAESSKHMGNGADAAAE